MFSAIIKKKIHELNTLKSYKIEKHIKGKDQKK
jgi:hypothetical protein